MYDSRFNDVTVSAHISNGHGDDFVGGSETCEHLAHAIFAQRSHAECACFLPEDKSGGALVDHVADLIIDYKNRSEEHTSELQSLRHLVCRLLLEKKKI